MKKEFSISQVSHVAWQDFSKEWLSWVLLASGGVILMLLSLTAQFYIQEHRLALLVFLSIPGAMYTAILHQNGLDAAYGRKLSMFTMTRSVLFASLFFIAISLYNPFPQYSEHLLMIFPDGFQFLMAINWIVHCIVTYVLMRCMFVGMIILEEKCLVLHAFKKSFAMTEHHLLLLFGVFLYLAFALTLSAFTIIGYFAVLPYTVLMKALLFKYLHENVK